MDEAIWAVVGILSIIIGIAAIANIFIQSNLGANQAEAGLSLLRAHCDQVCKLPQDTAVSIDVRFPKNTILTTQGSVLCVEVDEERSCDRCNCNHKLNETKLDLREAFFDSHTYACRYTKEAQTVRLECAG